MKNPLLEKSLREVIIEALYALGPHYLTDLHDKGHITTQVMLAISHECCSKEERGDRPHNKKHIAEALDHHNEKNKKAGAPREHDDVTARFDTDILGFN